MATAGLTDGSGSVDGLSGCKASIGWLDTMRKLLRWFGDLGPYGFVGLRVGKPGLSAEACIHQAANDLPSRSPQLGEQQVPT